MVIILAVVVTNGLQILGFLDMENKIDGGNSRGVSEKKARGWCTSKGNVLTLAL